MTNTTPEPLAQITIMTIEGQGWREVYKVMPNGDKVLIWYSTPPEEGKWSEATAMIVTEYVPWSEFITQYRNKSHS